jgi:ligand-binding sensor domain-containing protein
MKRTLAIIPVILCLVFSQMNAQVFTHYRSAVDYNYMKDVAFDKEGNTWYATFAAGVLKYDGSVWTNYTSEDGLASDSTHAITCDAEGNIWVVTLKGISVYDGAEWTSYFEANDSDRTDFRFGTIEADSFGNIWVVKDPGMLKYDGSEWTHVFAFTARSDDPIAVATDSIFWLGGDWGVSYYKGDDTGWDGTWIHYTTEDGLVDNHVRAIEIDGDGHVWFGTEGGVSEFDGTSWTSYTEDNGLPNNDVIDITIDAEGKIWCASPLSVSVFYGQNWTTPEQPDVAPGLIHSVVAADDGTILIGINFGTMFNSYLKYDGSDWTAMESYDECVAGYVSAIAEDDQGNKWFGTNAGVSKFTDGIWTTHTTEDGLSGQRVYDILVDPDGNIWCGTPGGVSVFNGTGWTSYTMDDGLATNVIRAIALDGSGNLWAGSEMGVSVFDGTSWINYTTADGLAGDWVKAVKADPEGNMWIGTDNGLSRYDGSAWSTFRREDGLSDNNINAIAFDTSGQVYCATRNGVSSFDGSEWRSLGEGNIAHIAVDSKNTLWMVPAGEWGTPEGITKFDGTKFIHYSEEDGLPVSGCIFLDSGDTLWIGTTAIADAGYTTSGFSTMAPNTDNTSPTAAVAYNDDDIRVGDALVITASFDEPMLFSSEVLISLEGAVELSEIPMLREDETTYSYTYLVPNQGGKVTVSFSGGFDLWGNELDTTPVSGEVFYITPVSKGDVDGDGMIRAYDAALTLRGTDPLNEFCYSPPLVSSWEYWQDYAADVDGVEGISVNDAEMILQQSTEISPLAVPNIWAPLQGGVVVVPRDSYIELYSSGGLWGVNLEVTWGRELLGTPEMIYDGFLSSFNINKDHYWVGLCGKCSPWESTLLMRIPVSDEGQVLFLIVANVAWMRPITVDVTLVPEDSTSTNIFDLTDPADLKIYPNPADDLLMIQGLKSAGILRIFNTSGKQMQTGKLNANLNEINISGLPEGIYILNLETKDGMIVRKVYVK